MTMASPNCVPSFFKVLVGDFTTKLELPPAFVKNFNTRVPKIVVLEYEGGRGLSWKIGIEESEDEYCFTKGWSDFVKEVNLNFGDSILFRLINKKTFEIVMYDTTCCEKVVDVSAVPRRITTQQHSDVNPTRDYRKNVKMEDRRREDGAARCSSPSNHLIRTLKNYQKHFFSVPSAYVERFGFTKHKGIVIKDPQRRVWPVKLAISRWGSKRRYVHHYLTTGWSNFLRANDAATGDILDFQFVGGQGNAVDVKILKKGLGTTEI